MELQLQLQQRQREQEQPQQLEQQPCVRGAVASAKMMASRFSFENLHKAWLDCRRRKRGKSTSLAFDANAEEELLALASELASRRYRPRPSFCFVARNDKYREVFAAQFRDRVVHHLLVRELEKSWEPVFIHDSYACRRGKGSHAAVERLQCFMRRVTANGTSRAWFLQLDIRSFFPSIDRRLLLEQVLSRLDDDELRWLAEVVIRHDPAIDPVLTCSREKWRNIPPGKSLFNAPSGKGLPIGNLTSQFFANLKTQYAFFRRRFRGVILFQVGKYFELFDRDALMAADNLDLKLISPRSGFYARCGVHRVRCWVLARALVELHRSVLVVAQSDMLQGPLKGRIGCALVYKQQLRVAD